uniref:Uncharacterized protein n=1 Tax=Spongospora subterranea TaxID=70186 RepID=A0A0H5QIE4_9EUKA|eukprot:CRZ01820.1 hypothetical protein [Spongospora subterranea]
MQWPTSEINSTNIPGNLRSFTLTHCPMMRFLTTSSVLVFLTVSGFTVLQVKSSIDSALTSKEIKTLLVEIRNEMKEMNLEVQEMKLEVQEMNPEAQVTTNPDTG